MGLLDDVALAARARPFFAAQSRKKPTESSLRTASELDDTASPAMLKGAAAWLETCADLAAAGFSPAEILRGCVRETLDDDRGPDASLLQHLFAADHDAAIARAVFAYLDSRETVSSRMRSVSTVAALRIVQVHSVLDSKFDKHLAVLQARPQLQHALLSALPVERREQVVLANIDHLRAFYVVEKLHDIAQLVATPAVLEARDRALVKAREEAAVSTSKLDKQDLAKLEARIAGAPQAPASNDALARVLGGRAKAERAKQLETFVFDIYSERTLTIDAPELTSMTAWTSAGPKRQLAIAKLVIEHLRGYDERGAYKLAGIETFHGGPIAVVTRGKVRMSIVPGGTFELGLSEEEEAAVRACAEVNVGCRNHYELYESLFDIASLMRPLVRITIGPMLVEQAEPDATSPKLALEALHDSPFRVPSEAEWEYLARGGRPRELTYRGDVVPDTRDEYAATLAGASTANAFGLWGFGLAPEICADAFTESHDDIPTDGTPRSGDGARVVRGGAAMLVPWQDTGEWQLLLSAMRTSQKAWNELVAVRRVIGIRIRTPRVV